MGYALGQPYAEDKIKRLTTPRNACDEESSVRQSQESGSMATKSYIPARNYGYDAWAISGTSQKRRCIVFCMRVISWRCGR